MVLDPRGSRWSRWDLHVHTPDSIIHKYPGQPEEAWEAFLSDLENLPRDFRVLGINDYLFLEGYERVLEERDRGRLENIDLILPVIELRLSAFGGTESQLSRVNYHVIFSDQLESSVIREQFLSALSRKFTLTPRFEDTVASAWSGVVTPSSLQDLGRTIIESVPEEMRAHYGSPLQEGFSNLTLPLEAIQEALDSSFLRGRYVTATGKTEWADIKWKDGSIADKKNIINSVDCVFTASESASTYHKAQRRLAAAGVNDRLLDCSDAHHLSISDEKDRIGNCQTWIKADPTFGGLLQALEEFDYRVFIGEEPPQKARVREHPSKYIDRVRISKVPGSEIDDPWFSLDLPLNSGLIAVIGNKGSGKSALVEVIGLASGTPHANHFSFLTDSKFRSPRQGLATNFRVDVLWRDGSNDPALLSDTVELGTEPKVQHLPQRYLESLCNEVPSGDKTRFDAELERIIFAHLTVDARLGAQSLDELILIRTGSIDTELEEQRKSLERVNAAIAGLEETLRPTVRRERLSAYQALRKEWFELRRNPPPVVPEPDESDPKLKSVREYLNELQIAKTHLSTFLDAKVAELAVARRDQADLASFRASLESLHRQHEALLKEKAQLLTRVGIEESLSTFTINFDQLNRARTKLATIEHALEVFLEGGDDADRGLRSVLDWIDTENEVKRAQLSAPEEARENYLKRLSLWEKEVEDLRGKQGSEDTTTVLGARRAYFSLNDIPARLNDLRKTRRVIAGDIHELLHQKAVESAALYRPLQEYMDSQDLPSDYQVSVGTSLVDTGFSETFLGELLNRHVAGSFCGVAESDRRLNALLGGTDFNDRESVLHFLDTIDEQLRRDMRQSPPSSTVPGDQVRKGKSVKDVYDWVYGLWYLSPRYGLLFGQKPIYQLSPGEKGTLLLVFFLLAEVDTRPLIIDQPEDNLDNNTVYRALVHCFQKSKERRQVLIVTHNPNLAVVCDADQIVVARMEKVGENHITYESGAIERTDTVAAVVDILEGTQPAFNNRSVKYTLHLIGKQSRPATK